MRYGTLNHYRCSSKIGEDWVFHDDVGRRIMVAGKNYAPEGFDKRLMYCVRVEVVNLPVKQRESWNITQIMILLVVNYRGK